MRAEDLPRILLCADRPEAVEDVSHPLNDARYRIDRHAIADGDLPDPAPYHLVLVDGGRGTEQALRFCRRLRGRLADGFVPILFVTDDPGPTTRLASLEAGADTYLLRPFTSGELLAQARAFLRIKEEHDKLTEKTVEVARMNRRLQQAYQQIDGELELARRLQLGFLPQALPQVPGARFAAHYAPQGQVGGDFYDVFRLDEGHVGLYVADAMGHGVPAALLTIFVKTGVRAKEVFGQQYRLVPPGEVLERLNREFLAQALSDQPFITMAYALLDHRERRLQFARAGHPYPLYVPGEGEPALWQVEGSLLGVFETTYPAQSHALQPGDKVLLYTDGIDNARFEGHPPGVPSLLACAARHRSRPVEEFVAHLARDLSGGDGPPDDFTLLGVEMV